MADFCGFLGGGGDPDRVATSELKQWVMMANAIFRPTHSCRVPQQLANHFRPRFHPTPEGRTTDGEAHGFL